jgi:hypothetical protein
LGNVEEGGIRESQNTIISPIQSNVQYLQLGKPEQQLFGSYNIKLH